MAEPVTIVSAVAATVQAAAAVASASADVWTAWVDPHISNRTSSDDVKEVRDKLDKSIERLCAKKKHYEKKVERDEKMEQSETFKQWIKDVLELEDEVNKLIVKYDKENEESSSNCGEEMKKKLEEVVKLLENGDKINDLLMVDRQLISVVKKKAPCIEKILTLKEKLECVLELLGNDEVSWIRISGMIGVGKTTLMLNLNNHEEVAKSFEVVIWVDVSKVDGDENLDTKDLQCQVLKRLGKESTEDEHTNASRISMTLMNKKYLLLLDDVKENLSLDKIGIPDAKNGSKVVLTTRRNEVCSLLVKRVVNVAPLHEKEALEMFLGILEDPEFIKNPRKYRLARKVLMDCHYIPLLIEQIAKTIKQKIRVEESEFIWKIGCSFPLLLEKASKNSVEEYYNLLKGFYYRQMTSDVLKRCFLFGALYPEGSDIYVVHLMECLAALYFDGNDYENVALAVSNTLQDLTNLSLLEESEDDGVTMDKTVTMRRFIRKMALYCALEDPECNYLVETDDTSKESPDAKSLRNKHHVSLIQNNFRRLPLIPDCSDLSTLILQKNSILSEIPDSIFQYMEKLKILDMCQTGIESLPSSISDLSALKVLYLRNCLSLKHLDFAIELPLLEALDIRGSKIVLTCTRNLERLRRLWISFEKCNVENGTEVRLSQLSALEELVIHTESFDQWNNKVLISNIIKEVASLKKLKSLEFRFCDNKKVINVIKYEPIVEMLEVRVPCIEILQIFIEESCLWRKFSHGKPFLIFIGCQIPEDPLFPVTLGYEKYIKYCDGEGTGPPNREVLATVEAFELVNHKDIVQLSDFGRVDRALLNLQHLHLKDLQQLTNIWSEPRECGSLVKLKTLFLSGCPKLTTIFPAEIIQLLHSMESLTVENCSGAVKIFEKFEDDGNGLNQLPNLKKMKLKELPKLESIWADESSKCQSLKRLNLVKCPRIDGASEQIHAPNLEHFKQE